ncbi:MAG: hypothetical protein AAGF06_05385 [Pseudomonadota bacterium]
MKQNGLYVSCFLYSLICAVELGVILFLNTGHFTFSLDDPYIHFSIAEGIRNGVYGINFNEFTAPGSSIIWPFLVALASYIFDPSVFVLTINFLLGLAILVCVYTIFKDYIFVQSPEIFNKYWSAIALVYILLSNLVGLVFVGMEHSLQVFLAVYVLYRLLAFEKGEPLTRFFWIALCGLPLVRYECLAFVFPILAYLFYKKYRVSSVTVGIVVVASLACFSMFLLHNGMHALPNSVLAKSSLIPNLHPLLKYPLNLLKNIINPFGWALLFFSVVLLRYFISNRNPLACVFCLAGFGHLVAGQLWWYGRYETYLLVTLSIVTVYLYQENVVAWLSHRRDRRKKLIIPSVLMCIPSLFIVVTIPLGAHGIYLQNVQLHKLATQYHQGSVAIHDIGLASYKNDHYVLDLWGLANKEALDYRRTVSRSDTAWVKELVDKHQVNLIWLTHGWFKSVPQEWIKVATFHRNDFTYAIPGVGAVSLYARTPESVSGIVTSLKAWKSELIEPSVLEFH